MFEQTIPETVQSPARNRLRELAGEVTSGEREPAFVGRLVERWVPPSMTRSPHRRRLSAIVAGMVAIVLLVGCSLLLLGGSPPAERAPSLPVAHDSPPVAAAAPSKAADSTLVVSVVGKVRSPGLVTVPNGARVADALGAAGGALRGTDVTTVNLARKLADGEQLYVGIPAPAGVGGRQEDPPAPPPPGEPAKVNLNTATVEQLDALPGVGAVTAQRIIDWRTEHKTFTTVDQLQEVDGIGPSKFAKLRDLVTV